MAVYQPHLYLTFGGYLGTSPSQPGEIWQCGLRFAYDTGAAGSFEPALPTQQSQAQLLAAAVPALSAMFTVAGGDITTAAKMTWVKSAAIGYNGLYLYDAPAIAEDLSVSGSASTSSQKPYQVCRVVSLGGGRNRGRASRGRLYLPSPAGSVSADNVSDGTNARTRFITMVNAINGTPFTGGGVDDGEARLGLFSSVGGEYQAVSRVGVDNKLDTQRRRSEDIDTVITWTPVTS